MQPAYYTGLCIGRSTKEITDRFFRRIFTESHKKLIFIFQADVTKLIKKVLHFLFGILAHVYDALWKRQLIASFRCTLKNIMKTQYAWVFSFLILN